MSRWWLAVGRLTGVLTCIGLATSRIGLIVHELVGHGGTAVALGREVTDVQLFWFAGGWIRHRVEAGGGELAIALGGIALEATIGTVLWFTLGSGGGLSVRFGGRIVRGIGAALILHSSWYLATGTWHGYGDGIQLHRDLGDAKWIVAVPAAAIACAAGYAGARAVFGALAATVPGQGRARISGTIVAILIAGGVQGGLAIGEVKLRHDVTYSQVLQPEREREIARELARWLAVAARHGIQPSEAARAEIERELDRKHTTFPFAWVLAVLTAAAMIAGAARATPAREFGPVPARFLAIAMVVAGGSIAAVIALDLALH